MPLETLNQFTSRVSDLPDKPNTQMTAAELKAQFDAAPEELRTKYNALVNVLKSSTAGDSGAENLGSANISGVAGNTVHGQIKDVFDQLKAVVLGQVPNKSITREKFADGAVDFSPVQKEIANLNLQLAASQLVPSGKTYGWDPKTSFGVIVDFTKGKTTAQLNAGDTSLEGKVTMAQGTFVAGKKVTVIGRNPADNAIVKEQATITSVSPLTISPLVNSYKSGAWIKRSTANNTTNGIKFGGVDDSVIKTVTDATVINQAYDTSGNGGRKLVSLSNGWQVSTAFDSPNKRQYFFVDKQDGNGFIQLCYATFNNGGVAFLPKGCLSAKGTRVFASVPSNNSNNCFVATFNFDATTVTNVDVGSYNYVALDLNQTAIDAPSTYIEGNEIFSTHHSKNATYPNSFNIRYAKGTINADGSVTWGAVEQITGVNAAGSDYKNPCILMYGSDVRIVFDFWNGSQAQIFIVGKNGLSNAASGSVLWRFSVIYSVASYAQSSPSAIFVPQSVNGLANGRIENFWNGTNATSTAGASLFYSYSDDGGITWSTATVLIQGGSTVSVGAQSATANKNNVVSVVFNHSNGTVSSVGRLTKTGSTWGSLTIVKSKSDNTASFPSTLFDLSVNFTEPLFIYKDTAKVGFYGTWTIGTETPITENTLRLTLTQQAKEVMTYLHHTAGLTATALVNGNVMDKTTTAEETQFTRVLGSLQDIEIEITLIRASVNDDITIDKVLGGIA